MKTLTKGIKGRHGRVRADSPVSYCPLKGAGGVRQLTLCKDRELHAEGGKAQVPKTKALLHSPGLRPQVSVHEQELLT